MAKQQVSVEMPKLENFSGSEFNIWKRKTQFGLKYLDVFYTVMSTFEETTEGIDQFQWAKDEDFCKDYLLNYMSDRLAEIYSKFKTAKEIWDNLDAQFKKEEALSKAHLVDKFMDMKFDGDREIFPQVTDLENLRIKLKADGIDVCDAFLVGAIIYKLPSSWLSFKTEMYRKKTQVGLDDLKRFIRIEDENRTRSNLELVNRQVSTANAVTTFKKHPKVQSKSTKNEPNQIPAKKIIAKFRGRCHNYGKWGHLQSEYRIPKKNKPEKPSTSKKEVNMVVEKAEPVGFIAMIRNGTASCNTSDWWLDSGANCHVCNDKRMLKEKTGASDSIIVANGASARVTHRGTAELTLSSDDGKNGGVERLNLDLDDDDLLDLDE